MTRTTRGTGIGLSLVKMLADAMGAHVDVANRQPGTDSASDFPAPPLRDVRASRKFVRSCCGAVVLLFGGLWSVVSALRAPQCVRA